MSEPKDFPQDMRVELFESTQILIPFTREEWEDITLAIGCFLEDCAAAGDNMEIWAPMDNIKDRIERMLGME